MLGVGGWDLRGGKAIHTETEKHMFGKHVLAGPAKTEGQKGMLTDFAGTSLSTQLAHSTATYGDCSLSSYLSSVFILILSI